MSTLEFTVSMIETLPEADLMIVKSFVAGLINYNRNKNEIRPLSESEFFERLAIARKHHAEGKVMDAREVAENVRAKYGLGQ